MTPRSPRNSWFPALVLIAGVLVACGDTDDGQAEDQEAEGPTVVITTNRTLFVDGVRYGPGVHYPDITFPDPDRPRLTLGQGPNATPVEMDGQALGEIHIDASVDSVSTPDLVLPQLTLVFGVYDTLPASSVEETGGEGEIQALAAKTWTCIWCQGEVLVCGVDPDCDGKIRP